MKVKFNKYERVAGLFILTAIVGSIVAMVGVAVKNGWFETKVKFETTLKNAEGVHVGTQVQMAGLRAGSVTEVELKSHNEIHVWFEVSEKFHDRVREDSVVRAFRLFIIGEKVLDLSVGSEEFPKIAGGAKLNSEATSDIMDVMSGRTLGPSLENMGKMVENLRIVAEQLLDPSRTKVFVQMFDQMAPMVKNLSFMASEVSGIIRDTNKQKQLVKLVDNMFIMTQELNKTLPVVNQVLPALAKTSPQLTEDLGKIAKNMAIMTDELQASLPALRELGPELPRASRRAIEALDETVITLKALQKSFLLRSSVKDVRDEEAQRDRERIPASTTAPEAQEKRDAEKK